LQNPPARVKTCSTPFSLKALANKTPPRILFDKFMHVLSLSANSLANFQSALSG
jgi:hypothetical protein